MSRFAKKMLEEGSYLSDDRANVVLTVILFVCIESTILLSHLAVYSDSILRAFLNLTVPRYGEDFLP
jgi:hypothetical protein